MPKILKAEAKEKAKEFCLSNSQSNPMLSRLVTDAISFADTQNTWSENKETFFGHTNSIDKIRSENFIETFPELTSLLNEEE
jgi:hypothetical protein